ncbi:hypothetical protein BO71DRAFT_399328, partial [Aspergillus ellipticus CBS 707.79]
MADYPDDEPVAEPSSNRTKRHYLAISYRHRECTVQAPSPPPVILARMAGPATLPSQQCLATRLEL